MDSAYDMQVRRPLKTRQGNGDEPIPQAELFARFPERQTSSLALALARLKNDGLLESVSRRGRGSWLKLSGTCEELMFRLDEVDRLLIPKILSVIPRSFGGGQTIEHVAEALAIAMKEAQRLDSEAPADIAQTTRESSIARCYQYLTGSTAMTFASDRAKGDAVRATSPTLAAAALAHKSFVRRAILYLARQGYRQFIDLGAGFTCNGSTSELLQRSVPLNEKFKVMYVDRDGNLAAASRLVLDPDDDRMHFVEADARDADRVMSAAKEFGITFTADRIAIIAAAVFHFEKDDEIVLRSLRTFKDRSARGSAFVISHALAGVRKPETYKIYNEMVAPIFPRNREQIEKMFDGLAIESANDARDTRHLVTAPEWRPDIPDPFLFGRSLPPVTSGTLVGIGVKKD